MDLYSFAPIAAVLDTAYVFLSSLVRLVEPLAGASSAVVAIVILTVLVRLALVPVGISQVRAERTRRRLAPALRELRRRFGSDPALLQRKTMELYKAEKTSPLAGCLPLLLQAPVLSTVYGLFVLGSINGHGNALLENTLGGLPLGSSVATALRSGFTGQAAAVCGVFVLVLATVAALARRTALAQTARDAALAAPAPRSSRSTQEASASGVPSIDPRVAAVLSYAPFVTVIVACVVPLAAAVYLVVSTTWTLVERAILRTYLK